MTATVQPTISADQLVTDEMLARFDERAPQYDRNGLAGSMLDILKSGVLGPHAIAALEHEAAAAKAG